MADPRSQGSGSQPIATGQLLSIDEERRLAALRSFHILDTPPEVVFDDLVKLAAQICAAPIAVVSLVDRNRSWFKARIGERAQELPRSITLCPYPVAERQPVVVPDMTQDERFRHLACVTGPPGFRFFAGYPLITRGGQALGALCVIDHEPKQPNESQDSAMRTLVGRVMAELELRKSAIELQDLRRREREIEDRLLDQRALDSFRLAADLQASVTEQLARVSAQLQALSEGRAPGTASQARERIAAANDELRQALDACQSLALRLTDGVLLQQGWCAALQSILSGLGEGIASRCQVDCRAEPEDYLDYAGLYHLLEIARAATLSVVLADEAARLRISLQASGNDLLLHVEAQGPGALQQSLAADWLGHARLMHHANCLAARIDVDARQGDPPRLRCTVPRTVVH